MCSLPVAEVQEAAGLVRVFVLEAEAGPAAQAVISHTQTELLGHRGLCGLPAWETTTGTGEGTRHINKSVLYTEIQIRNSINIGTQRIVSYQDGEPLLGSFTMFV